MKTLLLDIENTPAMAHVYGPARVKYIAPANVVQPSSVLCFAAKWLGRPKIFFHSVHYDGRRGMIQAAHDLLDEADVVMTYYGRRFDIPKLNTAMLLGGLKPPSPYRQIDLYYVVRSQFDFEYKRLDYVAKALGLKGKVSHAGLALWLACMEGDPKAWKTMRKYNIQDVRLLEELYGFMQPWIPHHPSHGALAGADVCPKCGSGELERRGYSVTQAGRFQRYCCKGCGGWSRDSKRLDGTQIVEAA